MTFNRFLENFSDWLLLGIWLALAAVMLVGLLQRNKPLSRWRKSLTVALHIVLWVSLGGLLWQPRWQTTNTTQRLLCYDNDVPRKQVKALQDSLHLNESYTATTLARKLLENPDWEEQLSEIYWVGQDFPPALLAKFRSPSMRWIPYFTENTLQQLAWTGVLAQGQKQHITGNINLSKPQLLRLQYADKVLDSLALPQGLSSFTLSFPVFALGKNHWQLTLAHQPLAEVHFFSFSMPKQRYLFLLSNPDFESKTLADWLGRQGNSVELITQVAKNTSYQVGINTAPNTQSFDCLITDASQVNNPLVKKSVAAGKSVLFINLSSPEQELSQINRTLGTTWAVQRTSNQTQRNVEPDLTALPYRFVHKPLQQLIFEEIALQKQQGKIAVSLLQETFGLMLSGDSLRYAKIWYNTLQALASKPIAEAHVAAPVVAEQPTSMALSPSNHTAMIINNDTLYTSPSPLQQAQQTGSFVPSTTGWQTWQDTLAMYVETPNTPLYKASNMQHFIQAYQADKKKNNAHSTFFQSLADEFWYILILFIMTLLWLEPKL